MNIKAILIVLAILTSLPSFVAGAETVSVTVGNTRREGQARLVTVDVRIPKGVAVTTNIILSVIIEEPKAGDSVGLPQNFALKGTSHEIRPDLYCISLALPPEKVRVKFLLMDMDKMKALHEQARVIKI